MSEATGDVNQLWYRCLLSVADMTRMGARLISRGVIPAGLIDEGRLGHLDAPGDAAGYAMGRPAAAADGATRTEGVAVSQVVGDSPREEGMQDVSAAASRSEAGEPETQGRGGGEVLEAAAVAKRRRVEDGAAVASGNAMGSRAGEVDDRALEDRMDTAVRGAIEDERVGVRMVLAVRAGQTSSTIAQGGDIVGEQCGGGGRRSVRMEEGADRRVRRRTGRESSAEEVECQAEGRTRMPWQGEPRWMRLARGLGGVDSEDEGVANLDGSADDGQQGEREVSRQRGGHTLRVTGPLVWCSSCAGYALRRWGVRLRGVCRPRKGDATRRRLELLHQGKHPLTGIPIL